MFKCRKKNEILTQFSKKTWNIIEYSAVTEYRVSACTINNYLELYRVFNKYIYQTYILLNKGEFLQIFSVPVFYHFPNISS